MEKAEYLDEIRNALNGFVNRVRCTLCDECVSKQTREWYVDAVKKELDDIIILSERLKKINRRTYIFFKGTFVCMNEVLSDGYRTADGDDFSEIIQCCNELMTELDKVN